jgi:hypothetical protein
MTISTFHFFRSYFYIFHIGFIGIFTIIWIEARIELEFASLIPIGRRKTMCVLRLLLHRRCSFLLSMIIPISVFSALPSHAAPGDINSINNGRDVSGGTYFNTPGSRTTFQNSGGSLWVHPGVLVRGLESNTSKTPTGNGGTLYFRAPGNVIRVDGTIDASAVRNGSLYTGNGGKVFMDSAYLFQSGNIFANGANGGLVQLNVGGMTLGGAAKITAQGFGGDGGTVTVNSTGTVDLQAGSQIDTSGKVGGTIDTSVINIEGSALNNQAILRANGLAVGDLKPDDGDAAAMRANPGLANNPVPRPITLGAGTGDTVRARNVLFETPPAADFRGGTVRLVAGGQTNATTGVINSTDAMTATEKSALNNRNGQVVSFNEGDVFQRGGVQANGGFNKNGGTIILSAARNVIVAGTTQANGGNAPAGIFDSSGNGANGGNGGTVALAALGRINNVSAIQTNGGIGARGQSRSLSTGNGQNASVTIVNLGGRGGDGGVIAVSTVGIANSGSIQANGGQGGEGGFATAVDTESAATGTPTARATANAGRGGTGGHGGLILFSGDSNPTGGGSVLANGGQGGNGGTASATAIASTTSGTPAAIASGSGGPGGAGGTTGTIITPNPATFASGQNFSDKAGGTGGTGPGTFRQTLTRNGVSATTTRTVPAIPGSLVAGGNSPLLTTRRNEYIRHEDAALLLSQANGPGTTSATLIGRMADALIRTVGNPSGSTSGSLANAESSKSLVISSTVPAGTFSANVVNTNIDPKFFDLNTLTILNNGNFSNNMLWTPGAHVVGAGFHDIEIAMGGGHISWLVNGSVTNNGIVITRGIWGGGSTHVAATQDVINNSDFINIAPNKALLEGFTVAGPIFDSSHAGSLILKGGRDVVNTSSGKMESNLIFFDIHPPLNQNPPIAWPRFLNAAQIGASVNLLAGRNLSNSGILRADALTYRNGQFALANPALTIGGIVVGRARTGSINAGVVTANGDAFFSPNESDGPRFNVNTFPRATSFPGTIDIR